MVKNRLTRQKRVIEEELKAFRTFFSAADLFERVQKKDASVGIATVYRFLKDYRKKHNLHSYLCNRKTIYTTNQTSHCHFTCISCKKAVHVSVDKLDFIKKKIPGEICHFQIDVHGYCSNCRNKKVRNTTLLQQLPLP